jgi:spermidine synthase
MNPFTRRILFLLFFLSGACSLIYQIVWTRMAFASFGIITPVLSVVLSVFMLGLAAGSWGGGRLVSSLGGKTGFRPVFFYAAIESSIGLGAFVVPKLFARGEHLLLSSGETNSLQYLSLSAVVLAVSILPWCVCMGATFPFMMAYIRECNQDERQSFSFLYLANVLGAMSGIFFTAIISIEMLGFHHTLWTAAAGNFTAAFISICLGLEQRSVAPATESTPPESTPSPPGAEDRGAARWILFLTGFISMAMEVVWTRAFTPVLKTQVYSFASIIFAYLGATFLGSWLYRRHLRNGRVIPIERLLFLLIVAAFLPVLVNDPRIVVQHFWSALIDRRSALLILASICPFCAALGYLTPRLIDNLSGGNPTRAGKAYAVNVLGCILGPLFACYLLLPFFSERHSLILLVLPFLGLWLLLSRSNFSTAARRILVFGPVIVVGLLFTEDFEKMLLKSGDGTVVRRDYAASVISYKKADNRETNKWLVVNGIDMTKLTPITKFMVHLPLAFHQKPPKSALVICFGMGTSYRAALNWDIDTTAVELVPGVTKAFDFYHPDTARYLNDPDGHIVIDDGRRYLNRSGKTFDVIIVDPPPPIETAGSSLLYSKEFCLLAKNHLNPGGILQIWFPSGDILTGQAIMRSLHETFPYVRCFISVEKWGTHFLASTAPLEPVTGKDLAARMPESARKDLVEWAPSTEVSAYLDQVLAREIPVDKLLNPDPNIQLTDDQPYNEYFLIRRWLR